MADLKSILDKYDTGALSETETLKLIFEETSTAVWQDRKKAKKEKKQAEAAKKEAHASSVGEVKAVLWKGGNYNQNCHDHLETDGGRNKVFQEFPHTDSAYTPRKAAFFKKHFVFPHGKQCNFNPRSTLTGKKGKNGKPKKAGNGKPYHWEGHHMIPGSAFYFKLATTKGKAKKSTPVFTPEQYQLLLLSDYDINHGHNLIPLPANRMDEFQPVHSLIQHPSDHENYTEMVMRKMQMISDELKKLKKKDQPHPDLKVEIANKLKKLENELWKFIVKLSRTLIGNKLAKLDPLTGLTEEQKAVVKFETKNKTTQYNWGALA